MATTTNNFNLKGLGAAIQLGKNGVQVINEDTNLKVASQDGSTLIPVSGADPRDGVDGDHDFITRQFFHGNTSDLTLKSPEDGNLNDGAITSWTINSTTYSTAIDDLNEVLGKLVPKAPENLSSKTISVQGGSNQLLCSSATDNTSGAIPGSGNSVYTVFNSSMTSSYANSAISGNFCFNASNGSLHSIINNSTNGTIVFDANLNIGVNQQNGQLNVSDDNWYPSGTPGFWQSFTARINASSIPVGFNNAKLSHTTTGNTNVISWVYDNVSASPSTSSLSYTEGTNSSYRFSSSVPHLTNGNTINVNATLANLTGQTYTTNNIMNITTNPSCGSSSFTATQLGTGLSFPLTSNLENQSPTNRVLTINNADVFSTTSLRVSATNVRGSSAPATSPGSIILIWTGSLTNIGSPIMEKSIYNTATSNVGLRILLNSQFDNPNDGITSVSDVTSGVNFFDSENVNLTTDNYEAAVVAGILSNNQTNYSTGYLPVGPNLTTGRNNIQYATFYIKGSSLSAFSIDITGTYSGIWVKLPDFDFTSAGLTKNSNYDAVNGWMNLGSTAPGTGMPGTSTNEMGCAFGQVAGGSSGSFRCTFNTGSSTYSADNMILVRIKMTSGQSISSLKFLA